MAHHRLPRLSPFTLSLLRNLCPEQNPHSPPPQHLSSPAHHRLLPRGHSSLPTGLSASELAPEMVRLIYSTQKDTFKTEVTSYLSSIENLPQTPTSLRVKPKPYAGHQGPRGLSGLVSSHCPLAHPAAAPQASGDSLRIPGTLLHQALKHLRFALPEMPFPQLFIRLIP